MEKSRRNKGITPVALVITIIVLLILAGVIIAMLTGENGMIVQAQKAKTQTEKATAKEKADLAIVASYDETGKINLEQLKNNLNNIEGIKTEIEDLTDNSFPLEVIVDGKIVTIIKDRNGNYCTSVEEYISKTEPYIGYYADVDDDGTIDGVIYADLAKGDNVEKRWNNDKDSTYTIPKVEASELKEYKIKTAEFPDGVAEDVFKTGKTKEEVIAPVSKDSNLEARFYIMALKNVDDDSHSWYKSAYDKMSDYGNTNLGEFGKGKEHTELMVERWNNGSNTTEGIVSYGIQVKSDMWGLIQGKTVNENGEVVTDTTKTNYYAQGWYVPSKAEWSAFASELKINKTTSNVKYYEDLGLSNCYWSSSQSNTRFGWTANFDYGYIYGHGVNNYHYVRLGMTF